MLSNSYSYEILYEQFHLIYLQGDIKLLLATVNNRLKFEMEIVHDLSCHPIVVFALCKAYCAIDSIRSKAWLQTYCGNEGSNVCLFCTILCRSRQFDL